MLTLRGQLMSLMLILEKKTTFNLVFHFILSIDVQVGRALFGSWILSIHTYLETVGLLASNKPSNQFEWMHC